MIRLKLLGVALLAYATTSAFAESENQLLPYDNLIQACYDGAIQAPAASEIQSVEEYIKVLEAARPEVAGEYRKIAERAWTAIRSPLGEQQDSLAGLVRVFYLQTLQFQDQMEGQYPDPHLLLQTYSWSIEWNGETYGFGITRDHTFVARDLKSSDWIRDRYEEYLQHARAVRGELAKKALSGEQKKTFLEASAIVVFVERYGARSTDTALNHYHRLDTALKMFAELQ